MSAILDELKEKGVELEPVLRRFLGKEEMYLKFLKRFLEDDSYTKMQISLEAYDAEGAFKACHTLKGVVTNLGLDGIMKTVIPITEKLRAGSLEGILELQKQLEKEYETVTEILRRYV